MPRPYRLKVLLEQRERALQEAEARLAEKQQILRQREKECQTARSQLREARAALTERRERARVEPGDERQARGWLQERQYQQRLVATLEARQEATRTAEKKLAEAQHTELAARQGLLSARREVEVLEKDRERFEARQRHQAERRAEREADELAAARYGPW
jgi:hypothetical protein